MTRTVDQQIADGYAAYWKSRPRTAAEQIDMVRRAIIEIEELRVRVKELEAERDRLKERIAEFDLLSGCQ